MENISSSTSEPNLLSAIGSPADLRKLPKEQLPQLCAEIRQFLIAELSCNPGHFASSMGAVELTVALHYVFNTPYDRIVWDVGHQAYGHKLLTGRREAFKANRKLGGISGFPSPSESEYDTFTAGHASNSISAALGMAVASELHNDQPRRNVVAVIGDASISGGLAFEGINNAANTPNNLLIILNDNDMSIDSNVGSLNSYMAHLTTSRSYNDVRYKLYQALRKMGVVNERSKGSIMRFNNSLKSLLAHQQNIFEGLNIRYFGPFDGHDIDSIVRVLNDIRDMKGPRILHLRTVKGKGYAPAEQDPAHWHAPGLFNPETGERAEGKPSSEPKPMKFQDVMGQALTTLARTDQNIVGITAAMLSGTSMATMQAEMPHRVFDVGISEGHAVTFAGGLAKDGLKPFVAIYSSFLQRAYDHIIHDVAIQNLPVTLCIDRAGLVGEDGPTHHGAFDLSYLRSIPNMTVGAPSDEQTLRDMLYTAASTPHGPMAIRYPRGAGRTIPPFPPMQHATPGKGRVLAEGDSDVAVLSLGVTEAAEAVRMAAEQNGIKATLYDMLWLKPLDNSILHEVATRFRRIITVEDGCRQGGFGSAVLEWLADSGFGNVEVKRIGIPDRFISQGTPAQLRQICGIDAESIRRAIVNQNATL
ncbi:MAG: 1-deoxy-D-xylulose-5-phosphate synthase [Muribaculaceae bacterium]|nr:1-deoxy-D-xylulose-5-phosphate synthase [Muribaculaceae bacterium]MDE6331693.1 1-deoxy-D-xylulose-5-phosphate synthase [Muribaculaceae bacterium]